VYYTSADNEGVAIQRKMASRVLVTGSTGFIGQHLVTALRNIGCEVVALIRSTSDTKKLPSGITIMSGDLQDIKTLYEPLTGVDCVFHLAAHMEFYPSKRNEELIYKVNVLGTENLVRAAIKQNVKRFIHCSTTETIGAVVNPPGDEYSPSNPSYAYGKSKLESEKVVKFECLKQTGPKRAMEWVIARPSGTFGPGDDYMIPEFISMVNMGLFFFVPANANYCIMYTHVSDVVDGLLLCMLTPRANGNTYILCADKALTTRQWVELFCSKLGRIKPFITLPVPLVKAVLKLLGPLFNIGRRRTFMFETHTIDRMLEHRDYSNQKAKNELGFNPKYTPESGVENTIRWMFEKNLLKKTPISIVGVVVILLCAIFIGKIIIAM